MRLVPTNFRTYLPVWCLISGLTAGFSASQTDVSAGTPAEVCTDPCLKAAIAALYIRSPFLSPFQVNITVKDAVVTLEGTVSTAGERDLAEEVANTVDGITAVVNRIRIEPSLSADHPAGAPLDCVTDDAALADRVRTQLYWNRATHGMAFDISARDGVITLRGQVADPQRAELARLITLNTCGVKQVESLLQPMSKR